MIIDTSSGSNLVSSLLAFPPGWAFRGQPSVKYLLISTLRRGLSGIAVEARRVLEQATVRTFVNEMGDRLSSDGDLEVLALMQHYGAPTRLIDFSYSPLVSLYFAFISSSEDAAMWAVDLTAARTAWLGFARKAGRVVHDYEVLPNASSLRSLQLANLQVQLDGGCVWPLTLVPANSTDRMRAQSGLFLAEPLGDDWVDPALAAGWLTKYSLPAALRVEVLEILMRANVHAGSLFPGTDGVGRLVNERLALGLLGI